MAGAPQPTPGYYGPPPGGPPPANPAGVIQERNSALVVVLMLVTCGIYYAYWIFKTSDELQRTTGDPTINPALDLVLSLVTCGLWGFYVHYRNAQKLHALLVRLDPQHQDQSSAVLLLCVATIFVGVTGVIASYLVQEDFNRLARGGR